MDHTFDTRAIDEVEAQIRAFVEEGVSFTALHVTNALRQSQKWAGSFGHARHLAPCTRDFYDESSSIFEGYSRTYKPPFYVYHPSNEDTSGVDFTVQVLPRTPLSLFEEGDIPRIGTFDGEPLQTAQSLGSVADPTKTTACTADLADTVQTPPTFSTSTPEGRVYYNGGKRATDGDVVRVKVSSRGDVQVPRAMTRALGWANGITVYPAPTSNGVCITSQKSGEVDEGIANLQQSEGALRIRVSKLFPWGVGYAPSVVAKLDIIGETISLSDPTPSE